MSILHHQSYFSVRSQRLRISFEDYVEYFLHYTNFEAVLVFPFKFSEQVVVSNNCVTNTMRHSTQSAGLLFGIEFESKLYWVQLNTTGESTQIVLGGENRSGEYIVVENYCVEHKSHSHVILLLNHHSTPL